MTPFYRAESVIVEMRKVQLTGGSTFIVSLPKRWANEVGIKVSDTVGMVPQTDGTLVLTPRLTKDEVLRRKTINLEEDLREKELLRDLIGAYVTGFDLIEVKQKPRMSTDTRKVVRKFTGMVIGPEIIDETIDVVKTRDLLDPSDLPFRTSIQRMYRIVSSMHKGAALACEELDVSLAMDIVTRDGEVDRLHWLVARQYNLLIRDVELAEKIGTSQEHAINYLLISRILERIGDHATRLADQVHELATTEVDQKVLKDLRAHSSRVVTILEDAITSLFERNGHLAHECMFRANDFLADLRTLESTIAHMPGDVALPLSVVIDSLERTCHYTKDIGECVINYVVDQDVEG
jgi:phosphate uptake regulator